MPRADTHRALARRLLEGASPEPGDTIEMQRFDVIQPADHGVDNTSPKRAHRAPGGEEAMAMRTFRILGLVAICASGLACGADPGDRISIVVVPFGVSHGGTAPPVDVALVIRADLAWGDRFTQPEVADLPSQPTHLSDVHFEDWEQIPVDYLVIGRVARAQGGGHEVKFRLLDVHTQQAIDVMTVPSAPHELGYTAHEIAHRIETRLGEEKRFGV